MKFKNMIVIAWTLLCTIFSAAFYVLFRQKKEEDQEMQEQLEKVKADREKMEAELKAEKDYREQLEETNKNYQEGLKVEAKTIQDLNSTDATVAIAASDKLLDDIRKRGQNRNNN